MAITVDEQKSEAIQPLETLFNFNNSFTVFVWLPIFQPLGPKGVGHGPNGPMVNTLVEGCAGYRVFTEAYNCEARTS